MINASDLLDQTKSNFNFKELKKFYLNSAKKFILLEWLVIMMRFLN